MSIASYPLERLLTKRKVIRKQLLRAADEAGTSVQDLRIAVLGGSTTNEVVDFLEILLLDSGFRPTFFQSEYGRYYEDAVLEPHIIADFKPDLVYIHTGIQNIQAFQPVAFTEADFQSFVAAELSRYQSIWSSLANAVRCQIIQNNFERPAFPNLGNLDSTSPGGQSRFILELNRQFALEAGNNPRLIVQDLAALSAQLGLKQWFDPERWFNYKFAHTVEASFSIANSLTSIARAIFGRSRKVLVLDLDNTLWGGVIGEDGPDRIVLGKETPVAEAYTAFQEYCLSLRRRGILLAVCSKNDEEIARQGFAHPDSVLKIEHFSAFKANWEPKHENILAIAKQLSLSPDSFVFVDDNPAERSLVESHIPGIAVPNIGDQAAHYAAIIDSGRYFELVSLGKEDLDRAKLYESNAERSKLQQRFTNYGEYLNSLEMSAEIDFFNSTYMERIAQLTNKTNQFNLTTRRYTLAEIQSTASDGNHIGLYGKLSDRFGDNGLISLVLGHQTGNTLHMDLWLMSCRVLKRDMEVAMLDSLVVRARDRNITTIVGYYIPSTKNAIVGRHYEKLGFILQSRDEASNSTVWSLDVTSYQPRSCHIRILISARA